MLKIKELKEIIMDTTYEAEVLIESIIDNDNCLWTTTKAWADKDIEGGGKPCLILQPTDFQICNDDNNLSVIDGVILVEMP